MNEITDPAAGIVAEVAAPVKKTCSKCGVEKALEDYHRCKNGRFGRQCMCKTCMREYLLIAQRRPEYAEKRRAYRQSLAYAERNRVRRQNPAYIEWMRCYVRRPDVKLRRRDYKRGAAQKKWNRQYEKKRRKENAPFRIKKILRARLAKVLKNSCKSARTLELLGCTVDELRAHLEKQFKPGMTWENQGRNGWHIDHIKPCASFDLTDPEQQRLCFHYTNLQPLWATENMSKGAKLLDTTPTA